MKKLLALVIAAALCAGLCGCASTVSVSGAQIDADGHLILSMSDGSTLDAGLARGEKGEKGDKGDKGEQGIQGLPGEKGEKGDKGDRGPRGEKGERGAQGIQGERGAAGYSGGSGASGRDGVDGKTPYIGENGNWWIDGKDTGVYAGNKVEPTPTPLPFVFDEYCRVTIKYWSYGYVSWQRSVKKGQPLKSVINEMPRSDSPSGFYFVGWFVGNTPFDIDTPINEDITVEAKYAAAAYTDENGFAFLDEARTKLVIYNGAASEITIPDTTVEIAAHAFANNRFIEKVTVQSGVKVIGDHAFSQCDKLQSVSLPNTISSISDYAFSGCPSLSSIDIPNGVTSIGRGVFNSCRNLKTLTLPESIKEIGEYAFDCSGLTSIVIPDSVTTLGDGAFFGTPLTSVTIGKGITALPDSVFEGCSELETVTIGSNITSIGDRAFYDCEKLKTVICEAETPPTLGGYILSGAPNLQIKVPANAVEAYKAAPIWSTYAPYITANS